jgi:hypothetical protein
MLQKTLLVGLLSCITFASADPLSQADLEELRERLKAIKEGALEHLDTRYKSAVDDYRSALQSEDAALNLFVKCVEKADFTDQQKKSQEFRDWKRREEGRLKNPEFKQALRHQLNWLSLAMRATARPDERHKLAPDVLEALNSIFTSAKQLEGQQRLLSEPVTETVFVRAYELGELKLKQWPLSPLDLGGAFDQVILPPLRKPKTIAALSEAWDKRIQMEASKVEFFSAERPEENALSKKVDSTPAMVKFREETLPDLKWKKELDLYKSGDQRAAALRMLAHIKEYITHNKANDWIDEFNALVSPEEKAEDEVK